MSAPAQRANTVYMSVSGNRGNSQIDRAKPGTTEEVKFPSPAHLNYDAPQKPGAAGRLRSPEQVKSAFLGTVARQLQAKNIDDMETFVYHGHGSRGNPVRGTPSRMSPGEMDVSKGGKTAKESLHISGREFATAIAASFTAGADKDKKRHFQFDSCWLGDTRGKNSSSFVSDFTSHMQKRGFTNFTVEGSRTQLNTTGNPSFASNNGRHGVEGKALREVPSKGKTLRPDLASGIPSLPSHVVPHPTAGGKTMDLLVRQHVPSRAALTAMDTPQVNAAATKIQAVYRGTQVRREFARQKAMTSASSQKK